jgi:hypothetical protein
MKTNDENFFALITRAIIKFGVNFVFILLFEVTKWSKREREGERERERSVGRESTTELNKK